MDFFKTVWRIEPGAAAYEGSLCHEDSLDRMYGLRVRGQREAEA
jgi:hypothetical protein